MPKFLPALKFIHLRRIPEKSAVPLFSHPLHKILQNKNLGNGKIRPPKQLPNQLVPPQQSFQLTKLTDPLALQHA
jgi:hypothetical protein